MKGLVGNPETLSCVSSLASPPHLTYYPRFMLLKINVTSHPLYFMLRLNWQPNERKAEAVQQGYRYDKAQPDYHAVKMLRNTSEINAKRLHMSLSNSVTDSKRMEVYFHSLQRFFKSTLTYLLFLDWNNHQNNAAINQHKPCLFSTNSTNSYLPRKNVLNILFSTFTKLSQSRNCNSLSWHLGMNEFLKIATLLQDPLSNRTLHGGADNVWIGKTEKCNSLYLIDSSHIFYNDYYM